jgi:hypothetical protein
MKKILLIIAIALCIFQMVVLAVEIDIGSPAIDRDGKSTGGYTCILTDNPANLTGKITSIEVWANINLTDLGVATFYIVSGNTLSTRDTAYIGEVIAGAKRTFTVDLDVEMGDYIGFYTVGSLERSETGFAGYWYKIGNQIPCDNISFTPAGVAKTMSLYGTGATVVGWEHKWNTLTISKWNTKEFTKWNDLE